jgi:hypothetical protein
MDMIFQFKKVIKFQSQENNPKNGKNKIKNLDHEDVRIKY